MTQLNQLIAVEKGVRKNLDEMITLGYHRIQSPTPFTGISRFYEPKDDEDTEVLPGESTQVQTTADKILAEVGRSWSRLIDVVSQKDATNQEAKADIVVNGLTIVSDVPVTTLLYLEKQLVDLRKLISKLPVLDPAKTWTYDPAADAYATDVAKTTRTKKIPRNHVKAPATDKHAAQVDVYYEDVVVGYWNTRHFSGALPASRVNELLERVDMLDAAVKQAREKANVIDVKPYKIGEAIISFVLDN